jgi:hypothetical protein
MEISKQESFRLGKKYFYKHTFRLIVYVKEMEALEAFLLILRGWPTAQQGCLKTPQNHIPWDFSHQETIFVGSQIARIIEQP